jgi:hypothetical protein
MYVWTGSVAGRQGYRVDAADIEETANWLVTSDQARIFSRAPDSGENKLSQATIFLAHALNALPDESPSRDVGWKRIGEHWQATQQPDGSWVGSAGRPPIFNTPEVVTSLLDLAAKERVPMQNRKQPVKAATLSLPPAAYAKTDTWLDKNKADESHQALVLRLWREAQSPEPQRNATAAALTKRLFALQRPDGGWRQVEGYESDAFATGQTMVALHKAGVALEDRVVQKAIGFLAKNQRENGSWPMNSRPNPANGQSASNLNPITYAATAWATMGLAMYVSESGADEN